MPKLIGRCLPIYRLTLSPPNSDSGPLLEALHLHDAAQSAIPGGGVRIEKGSSYLEVCPDRGIWFSDDGALWNARRRGDALPPLADAATAGVVLLNRLGLTPQSNGGAAITTRIAVCARSRTATARRDHQGNLQRTECYDIDSYVGLGARVTVPHPHSGDLAPIDVVGPGTKTGVAFGAGNQIVGMNAAWRRIEGVETRARTLPPEHHTDVHDPTDPPDDVIVHADTARLVYRVTSMAHGAACLAPFWLCAATAVRGDARQRTSDVAVPAAEFEVAESAQSGLLYQSRTPESVPSEGPGSYSAAVSWKSSRLSDANHEVRLVLRELAAAGWNVRFAWRDRDAWQSDWSTDAARWVDGADLAYYTGHADAASWWLTDGRTGRNQALTAWLVGDLDPQKTLWGTRLKWIMIGACGPLWDDYSLEQAGAFKWAGAFDGLRMIMGFGSTTAGFTREGSRTLELARRGVPLARAWLRAAREGQVSNGPQADGGVAMNRVAAVLAIESENGSALDDQLPGAGVPTADLGTDTWLRAIWTPA